MKNSATETTGYEYFKKQNDRVLKKFLYDNNKKDTSSLQSINPAKYSCTTATNIKQTFQYYQHDIYNEPYCILSKL